VEYDRCQLDDCKRAAVYYLAYSCIEQHVADTKACKPHLDLVKDLVGKKMFRCGQCPRHVISGMYRLISSRAQRIITRRLDGTPVKTIPNPDYRDLTVTRGFSEVITGCTCPHGGSGMHQYRCPLAAGNDWSKVAAVRKSVDLIDDDDWEALWNDSYPG
jgi:hypothetical protein